MTVPVILWFRRDLRLSDQAALLAAVEEGPVIPVYVLDDDTPKHRAMGGASLWWLHHSLESLDAALREKRSRLILRRGACADVLPALAKEVGATRVHALHHYEPWWRNAEKAVGERLDLQLHDGNYLMPPGTIRTGSGGLYKIYTPFMRALWQHMPPVEPHPAPRSIPAPDTWPKSEKLADWQLLPTKPDWAKRFAEEWTPGEEGAAERLRAFLPHTHGYDEGRNLPSIEGSSRLSPHLHFGEISVAEIWHKINDLKGDHDTYLKELVWRDYAQNMILAFPDYGKANGRAQFDAMPWRSEQQAKSDVAAWRQGRTGYPIVDAGMRQLWATGWMHNRVRMIAASFLVKHLLVDWRVGDAWFWDTLVDADYASNSVNWQWVMGSGVDANMFTRIMAPLTQSAKFDAGDYIRKWVPELAGVKGDAIHDPDDHGCRPKDYPRKIIGHREARERALSAYAHVKA
ncbi:MAG: cryptochrome/photolyase family protein [Sphingobium sp.]